MSGGDAGGESCLFRAVAECAQAVPGGELLDELLVFDRLNVAEEPAEPVLKEDQVAVSVVQDPVLHEQVTQVHGGLRGRVVVQRFVAEWQAPGGESCQ